MPVNLAALAPLTTAASALSGLILVSPNDVRGYQPQNFPADAGKPQPESFLFQYEGEQSLVAESDIPDHYVENNTAVQDQIALKPVIYTTRGYIGELNDIAPNFLKPIKAIANKLTAIGSYAPQLTTTGLIAYSEAFFLYQVTQQAANAAVSAWSSVSNFLDDSTIGQPQNKQQIAFQKLYGYQQERRLFTIQTPWASFQDMAIQRLRVLQDEETNVISDFEIVFKQIRFAATLTSNDSSLLFSNKFQGHSVAQASSLTNLGTSSPTSSTSLASGLSSMGVA